MKRLMLVAALAAATAVHAAEPAPATTPAAAAAPAASDADRISFAVGYSIGKRTAAESPVLNADQFSAGLKDGFSKDSDPAKEAYSLGYLTGKGVLRSAEPDWSAAQIAAGFMAAFQNKPGLLTEDQVKQALTEYKNRKAEQMQADQQRQADDNKAKGAAYLAENSHKVGVMTTKSGLQYEVLKAGTGAQPKPEDTVEVNYEGKLIDGTVFDSSAQHGQAASFRLDQVIPGWTEGVQLMKEGSKYRFTIPSALAYGEQGAPGAIPPNSVLVFEVELLKVTRAAPADKPAEKAEKPAKGGKKK